jgi:phage baseplate assembly protein W
MATETYTTVSGVTLQKSILVSRNRPYADLDITLEPHPEFHDIVPLYDTDAVKSAVRNLVLTNFNERPFQPNLGSNLRALLFEPADNITIGAIRSNIERVIRKYEPRVDQVQVDVEDQSDNNAYRVTVTFRVINLSDTTEVYIQLERLR